MFSKIYAGLKKFIKENWLFLLILIIFFVVNFVRLPYEVEMPGGTIDLGNRITVDGKKPDIKGSFNMAYVEVSQGSVLYVLAGLIIPDWEVLKVSDLIYENETLEDSNLRDKIYLEQSKNAATLAALNASGTKYTISKINNSVVYVDKEAETDIKIGDDIIECDGETVENLEKVVEIVKTKKAGDVIKLKVLRDEKKVDVTAKVYDTEDGPKIGLMSLTTYDIDSEKKVKIDSKTSESGPSGGLMMSLMIYNALTDQDLTNGKKVVGTGTIDEAGNVGEIGGVKFKIMGAVKDKADVFLVPAENYDEAMEVKKKKKYDIEIVRVETLQDAIDYLEGK
mgnify:CR=1 FL=1